MTERDERVDLVRRYLLDASENAFSFLDLGDALPYLMWNFRRAVLESLRYEDSVRGVERVQTTLALDGAGFGPHRIETPVVAIRLDAAEKIARDKERFREYFRRTFVAPLVAEEDRVLLYSDERTVYLPFEVRTHADRFADAFRFKVWEIATFPGAQDVPPARIPAPEEEVPAPERLC